MTNFGDFHHYRVLPLHNVLRAEKIKSPCAFAEFVIKECIVIGLPGDLCDVEISWNAQSGTEPVQLSFFERLALQTQANLCERREVLAKSVVCSFCGLDLVGDVRGQR